MQGSLHIPAGELLCQRPAGGVCGLSTTEVSNKDGKKEKTSRLAHTSTLKLRDCRRNPECSGKGPQTCNRKVPETGEEHKLDASPQNCRT